MDLRKLYVTKNACFIAGVKHKPLGIMVHSTGANNPTLRRYVPVPNEPVNTNNWDNYHPGGKVMGSHKFVTGTNGKCATCGGTQVCVHGFIGKLQDGSIATYQILPWDMRGWHSASGSNGSANSMGYIGFEICEDDLKDSVYFNKVYTEAVELCAYLCKEYNIPINKIICHSEGHKLGIASNHADVMHWFPRFGKSMDTFRADVKALLEGVEDTMTKEELKGFIEETVRNMGKGSSPSAWAVESVEKAKDMGISDGSNPLSYTTREQTMSMIMRAVETMGKNDQK